MRNSQRSVGGLEGTVKPPEPLILVCEDVYAELHSEASRLVQILRWLFPWVPTRSGLQRNRLPLISRWKIFDNLRRSLVPPATLTLLAAAWTVLPGHPVAWTLAALAILAFPFLALLLQVLGGPPPRPADSPWPATNMRGPTIFPMLIRSRIA